MINETENIQGNFPQNESGATSKLKSYGTKGMAPLLELVHNYQDEITPFIDALSRGLTAGAAALKEGEGANPVVSGWFSEASSAITNMRGKLSSGNAQDFIAAIEDYGRRYPGVIFSSSYLAGLFLGRVGRHIGRKAVSEKQSELH